MRSKDPKQTAESKEASPLPLVSVVMPVRNEASFIEQGLQRLLTQDYPADRMEIIVTDGMSDDGTREILAQVQARDPRVRVIDNAERIQATGLNAAVEASRGAVIIRVDGHAEVARDFVRQSVAVLEEHPEAWCVSGPIVHVGTTRFGKAAAAAMSRRFGVGDAKHRFADYEGYGRCAAFPAIRRSAFERVGKFDEHLIRTEDDDWSFRVWKAGGRVYLSPRIRYQYIVRDRMGKLFHQYLQYGFWRIPMIYKHRRPTTLRQLVPPLFFLLVAVLAAAGAWLRRPALAAALPAAYLAVLAATALLETRRVGLRVALLVPVAMATMHVSYALGAFYGLAALPFLRRAWSRDHHMTTVTR